MRPLSATALICWAPLAPVSLNDRSELHILLMVTQKVCGKVKKQTSLMYVVRASPQRSKEQHSSLLANQCVAVCCPLSHHSCWTPPLGELLNFYNIHKILMGFAKWIKGPYSFRAVYWILKTYVSRALNLLEARGGGEENNTKISEECCHVCPNENYTKPFWRGTA